MNPPTAIKRFSPWLRFFAWCGFAILCLATLLVVTRWLVMEHGHQEALRITQSQKKKPSTPVRTGTKTVAADVKKETMRGIPLASLPNFAHVFSMSEEEWKRFRNGLGISEFYSSTHAPGYTAPRVDGNLSFRGILQNMDGGVHYSMTEEEAATEFLKRAERFSDILAQWREAVGKGPMAREDDHAPNHPLWRFGVMSSIFSSLLEMTTAAHLRTGDSDAAWADWQTMRDANDREAELFPEGSRRDRAMTDAMFDLARSGVRMGVWDDAQMTAMSGVAADENFMALAQRDIDAGKRFKTDFYDNFRKNEDAFRRRFLETPSPVNQVANQLKLQLITDQQIEDNKALALYRLDQALSRFDPETGYYVPPTEAEKQAGEEKSKPDMFGSYYFMLEDMNGPPKHQDGMTRIVIRQQAEYDQFRFSTALETYQRRTGSYPENLEAVSSQFPGGAPQDIATGQPYFYQREPDGGYKLWSTGIDGKSDGGDDETDVTWRQTARKR